MHSTATPAARRFHTLMLVLLSGVLAYAVFRAGGVLRRDQYVFLFVLGLLGSAYSLFAVVNRLPCKVDRALLWPLILLPAYGALQLVPLPVTLLRLVSPARASLVQALAPVVPGLRFASLSVYPSAGLNRLLVMGGCILIFLLAYQLSVSLGNQRWAAAAPIVIIAAAEAALGVAQFSGSGMDGGTGTYGNRNHFAGLLEMALPLASMYPISIWRRAEGRQPPARAVAAVCAASGAAVLIFLGIICSFSRMGLIACLGSLACLSALAFRQGSRRSRRWLVAAALAAASVAGAASLTPIRFIERFGKISSKPAAEADLRPQLWRDTSRLIAAYWTVGCGLGAYEPAFTKYKVVDPSGAYDYAHNDYLQILAEFGVIGSLLVAAFVYAVVTRSFRNLGPQFSPDPLTAASMAALAAIMIHSLTDFNLYIPANAMVLAWILGISTAPLAASASYSGRASVLPRNWTKDPHAPIHSLRRQMLVCKTAKAQLH
ncbi:MAG TPA: O-antigen ligase family protein [Bryobacterales bacterium]|jgi:O-antigen ligase|nr:O-antigen ligase family protein [Bryobacterales bacterium]